MQHDDLGQLADALRLSPLAEAPDDVGADEKISGGVGMPAFEFSERMNGVGDALTLNLDGIDREAVIVSGEEVHHLEPLLGRAVSWALQWLGGIGNEPEGVESQCLDRIRCREQMARVRRVEGPAEDAQSHRQKGGGEGGVGGGEAGAAGAGTSLHVEVIPASDGKRPRASAQTSRYSSVYPIDL